ncbi:MAG: molybdenum cofactor guanylyltransferase [Dethiobacter sp.]|nr:molybdenum cofactor guanylyltransferase [Dethiobacter sp.]
MLQTDRGAIILAGGDSTRLGINKSLLELKGETLIKRAVFTLRAYFTQITLVADHPELFAHLPVRLAGDILTGYAKNPLRGIHAGLSAGNLPYQFVLACDMPFINLRLIRYMAQFAGRYDAVVPRNGNFHQPLHAFYSSSCLEPIRRQVEQGGGKITAFYHEVRVKYIDSAEIKRFDPMELSFFNINSRADYEEAQKLAALTRRGGC